MTIQEKPEELLKGGGHIKETIDPIDLNHPNHRSRNGREMSSVKLDPQVHDLV
jgi:hypothetical protein